MGLTRAGQTPIIAQPFPSPRREWFQTEGAKEILCQGVFPVVIGAGPSDQPDATEGRDPCRPRCPNRIFWDARMVNGRESQEASTTHPVATSLLTKFQQIVFAHDLT